MVNVALFWFLLCKVVLAVRIEGDDGSTISSLTESHAMYGMFPAGIHNNAELGRKLLDHRVTTQEYNFLECAFQETSPSEIYQNCYHGFRFQLTSGEDDTRFFFRLKQLLDSLPSSFYPLTDAGDFILSKQVSQVLSSYNIRIAHEMLYDIKRSDSVKAEFVFKALDSTDLVNAVFDLIEAAFKTTRTFYQVSIDYWGPYKGISVSFLYSVKSPEYRLSLVSVYENISDRFESVLSEITPVFQYTRSRLVSFSSFSGGIEHGVKLSHFVYAFNQVNKEFIPFETVDALRAYDFPTNNLWSFKATKVTVSTIDLQNSFQRVKDMISSSEIHFLRCMYQKKNVCSRCIAESTPMPEFDAKVWKVRRQFAMDTALARFSKPSKYALPAYPANIDESMVMVNKAFQRNTEMGLFEVSLAIEKSGTLEDNSKLFWNMFSYILSNRKLHIAKINFPSDLMLNVIQFTAVAPTSKGMFEEYTNICNEMHRFHNRLAKPLLFDTLDRCRIKAAPLGQMRYIPNLCRNVSQAIDDHYYPDQLLTKWKWRNNPFAFDWHSISI